MIQVLFPKAHEADKGKQGKNCNVTHCQEPNSAHHYNRITQAWYCRDCAERIERCAKADGMSFFSDLEKDDANE